MAETPLLVKPGEETSPGGTKATETQEAEVVEAKTAFVVFIKDDGSVVMSPDLNLPIVSERQPTINEVYSACALVMKDIQNQETAVLAAQHTVNAQMQMAQRMHDAQMNQQALRGLQLK